MNLKIYSGLVLSLFISFSAGANPKWDQFQSQASNLSGTQTKGWFDLRKDRLASSRTITFNAEVTFQSTGLVRSSNYTTFNGGIHIANGKAANFQRKQQHPGVVNLDLAQVIPESIKADGDFSKMNYPFTPYCTLEIVYSEKQQVTVATADKAYALRDLEAFRFINPQGMNAEILVLNGSFKGEGDERVNLSCYSPSSGPTNETNVLTLVQQILGNFATVK